MEEKYTKTIFQMAEDKYINYDENVRRLIEVITRQQGNIDLDDRRVFGKHIHAFIWAFFTGVYEDKRITPEKWEYDQTFSLGTMHRDQAGLAADTMLLIGLGEIKVEDLDKTFTSNSGIRKLLNIISSFAEGGAKHILEIRETEGNETYLDSPYHFHDEIKARIKSEKVSKEKKQIL